MAYNPFNIFRRNQKAIFAVVTVFIMFTFVLSSGLGGGADFFDWLPQWVRGKTKRGEFLCTLDGNKVYSRDLENLRFQRVIANKYLAYAATEAGQNLQNSVRDLQAQATPQLMQSLMQQQLREQMGFALPGTFEQASQQALDSPLTKQADKDVIHAMRAELSFAQMQRRFGQTGSYLTATPNRTSRDLIEFMLWDKKAHELGIEFADGDVKALVQKEFLGKFPSDVQVMQALRNEYRDRFSLDFALKALAAEFRVRAAQTALLGPVTVRSDHTLTAPAVYSPPYDVFQFYREKTSPTAYEFLAVPAAAFVGQVTATPTEDELRRLFDERKDYEPDPSKEQPGFREPRKVKVEWVSVTGEEPYYRSMAAEYLTKGPVAVAFVPPAIGAWSTLAVAPFGAADPLLRQEYERKVSDHKFQLDNKWDRPTFSNFFGALSGVLDTSVVRPANLVAAAGGAAGSAAGLGGPLLPANLLVGATVAAEQRGRIRAGMPLFLGTVPGPGMLATAVGGEAAYRKNLPEPLPVEAYRPELLKELTERKARELAVNDLKKLKEEVDKLTDNGRAKDKSSAKAYIAEFVEARGIKTGASTDFHSEWTIGDDPGLAPLKAVLDKSGTDPHAALRERGPVQFGQSFFYTTNPRTQAKEPTTGTYKPEFYPERAAENALNPFAPKAEPVFLAWRTEERPAQSVPYNVAKPRVVEAWKRLKARDLAKAEAERLANELRAKPGQSDFVIEQDIKDMQAQVQAKTTDPKAKDRVRLFKVENVAPLQITVTPGMGQFGGGGETVQLFKLAPTADLPYPTPEMEKALLDDRTKPVKTVLVQPDQPKDTYYVITLMGRRERGPEEFRLQVYGAGPLGRSQVGDQVRMAQFQDERDKTRDSILGLLKKEFNYVETEDQKKKLDEREKRGEE